MTYKYQGAYEFINSRLSASSDEDLDILRRQAEVHEDEGVRDICLPAIEAEIVSRHVATT